MNKKAAQPKAARRVKVLPKAERLEIEAHADRPEERAAVEFVGRGLGTLERPGEVRDCEEEGLGEHVKLEPTLDPRGSNVAGVVAIKRPNV